MSQCIALRKAAGPRSQRTRCPRQAPRHQHTRSRSLPCGTRDQLRPGTLAASLPQKPSPHTLQSPACRGPSSVKLSCPLCAWPLQCRDLQRAAGTWGWRRQPCWQAHSLPLTRPTAQAHYPIVVLSLITVFTANTGTHTERESIPCHTVGGRVVHPQRGCRPAPPPLQEGAPGPLGKELEKLRRSWAGSLLQECWGAGLHSWPGRMLTVLPADCLASPMAQQSPPPGPSQHILGAL